jgi:hypothetical protein
LNDIRRCAQIGVFLLGLTQLPGVVFYASSLIAYGGKVDWGMVPIYAGQLIFVASLLFASSAWAAILGGSGTVSALRDLRRDDFLRAAVPVLGLYFLLAGVSDVLGAILRWFMVRGSEDFRNAPVFAFVESSSVVRAVLGAALILWASNVWALIHWAQTLGEKRGAA